MNIFKHQSRWDRISDQLGRVDGRSVAKSGSSAGAALLALTLASAAVSALRRRSERA